MPAVFIALTVFDWLYRLAVIGQLQFDWMLDLNVACRSNCVLLETLSW